MHLRRPLPLLLLATFAATACEVGGTGPAGSPWDEPGFEEKGHEAVERYTHIVYDSYADALAGAQELKDAVDAFVDAPSADGLQAARDAWLAAREIYGQTEVYRFYGGPIDAEPANLEGQINSWPLDEVYIDYVEGKPDAGIINDLVNYPDLTADLLIELNGAGSETDISTGWHAIEFLLWGQDLDDAGPGARPWADYDPASTAPNVERRKQYLQLVTDLLVADLQTLVDTWAEGAAFHEEFGHQDPKEGITKILLGMGSLSGAELAGERMTVAYDTREQEDEHSCFSDNTHRDLVTNAIGIENVYIGRWGGDGASISSLVAELDPELDAKMREQLGASVAALEAIPAPFDAAIQAPEGDPKRKAVADAIAALKAQTETTVEVATLLEISLNLE